MKLALLLLLGLAGIGEAATVPAWVSSLTTGKGPGGFPLPAPAALTYRFRWAGITAAQAEVQLGSGNRDTIEIDAKGGTVGLPRALFSLDVEQQAVASKATLRPVQLNQEERYRNQTIRTTIDFSAADLTRHREVTPGKAPPQTATFHGAPAFDLFSALLWVRSQPLRNGDAEVMVVYPFSAPYLATIRVLGREKIRVGTQEKNAIKLDLRLKKIDRHLELKEHNKFRSGQAWLADDELRTPLRVEANLFIGTVVADLVLVH